jgi:hypothetical protein
MEWVRTFDFSSNADEVWAAFVDAPQSMTWNDVVPSADVAADRSITWADHHEDIGVEMSMRLEVTETESGARVTLTRSGFGEGDMFDIRQTSKLVAWTEAMHDLAVYLECGVDLRRLHASHPDHQNSSTGVQFREEPGGMRVTATQPGSFGEQAGLGEGDLVVRLAGVPVFERSDLWLLTRLSPAGQETAVQYVRGGEVRETSAPMSPLDSWATGELGGGPRE